MLVDIEIGSAKTEVCDCKKREQFGITKPAIIMKKKEVISINQLNYKAPEKSLASEELVGCIP